MAKVTGRADPYMEAKEELIGSKERMTQGFSGAEMDEAVQRILGIEQVGRARTARTMTRGGGAFDPKAFARATAGLTGGTQRAVGGLKASSAMMSRQGLENYLKLYMQLYGTKTSSDLAQQQMAMQRQQQQQQMMMGVGSSLGGVFGG